MDESNLSTQDAQASNARGTNPATGSVGIVQPRQLHFREPLQLDSGHTLPEHDIVYETYGELNAAASNAVLVCHALSGDQHAAGYHTPEDDKPGWWENCIGPGKAIDTNKFFVVCPGNLGSCKGSTGPNTTNPDTGRIYGPDFPIVTVRDWVRSQRLVGHSLGIKRWAAAVGGSLGAMQVMQWSIDFPEEIAHAVVIAAAPKLSAQNIAFNEVARQAILSDPDFQSGRYEENDNGPRRGLALARMLGHITYLSDTAMREKFGRDLRDGKLNFNFDVEFQVESYLRYQGRSFVDRFDANSYLLMTKTLDYFDPAREYDNQLHLAFRRATARFLVISFSSDWRFPPKRSQEIVKALIDADQEVSYAEIQADLGHDDFLKPIPQYMNVLGGYMQRVANEAHT